MAALTVDFRKHSGPTPADDMAAQTITDWGNFTLDFKQHRLCAFPVFLQTLGPWFPNEMQNLLSSEKRTLDHWATVQFFFSLAQVRFFFSCLCFRSGLVAHFLKMSERGDSWWLQFPPCEALPSVWIGFAWQYSQACGHPCCLCTFFYPISSFQPTLHLICFDTALLGQPPLSVITLCDFQLLTSVLIFEMYLYISKLTAHVFNTSQSIMNVWKYNWVTLTCDWHYVEQSPHRLRADVTEPVFGDQQLGQVKGHLARDGALHLSPAVRVLHTNIQTTQCQEAFRVCVITVGLFCTFWIYIYILFYHIYIYAFSRRYYPKRLTVHSGYTFLSVCVFPGNWTHNLLRC